MLNRFSDSLINKQQPGFKIFMNSTKPNIYLIPRWAGTIHSDWYDWMVLEIKLKFHVEIHRFEMPDWDQPDISKSIQFLESEISELNENTYFIGHSVGCQAILRFIDQQLKVNKNLKIGGFLFVAGWFEVDKPWLSLKPWMKIENVDFHGISQQINFKKVLISDNDPFTTDFLKNKSLWYEYINAGVNIYHNKLHFNNSIEIEVLNEIEKMINYSINVNNLS